MRLRRSLALGVLLVVCLAECHPGPSPRSLVLIVIDTLRRDHLAAYGYPRETAPTLSRLAAEGAVLEGLSPSAWTKPATASLLTGLHPLRHQAIANEDALPGAALTLAERLRARGYRTLAASGNISVAPGFGFDQGFDAFVLGKEAGFGVGPRALDLNRQLWPHLESLRAPYFLYVHYVDPHTPYEPLTAWDGAPLEARPAARRPLAAKELASTEFRARPRELLRDAVDLYDGEIRGADGGIAELLARLHELDLLRETLTIITADHGEEFEEHGRMEHGQTLYEEVVRVPLIVHAPGLVLPGPRRGAVSLLDVVPTVADLLGMPVEAASLDGVNLAPLLRGGPPLANDAREFLLHLDDRGASWLALESGSEKLVLGRGPYRKELFDLGQDPREQRSLAGSAERAAAFTRLAESLATRYNALLSRALPRTPGRPSPEVRQALRGLGYVSLDDAPRGILAAIRPAPSEGVGLLGWESPGGFDACVRPADARAVPQLLAGWWPVELGGRWTRPAASVALAAPSVGGGLTLTIRGANLDRRPARIRVRVDGRSVVNRRLPPGDFDFAGRVDSVLAGTALVEIERQPPFIPSEIGLPDDRSLGVLVRSVCLRP